MSFDIIWLESAKSDLNRLYNYYADKSISVAVRIYNGIIDESERLSNYPEIASVEPLIQKPSKTYRSLVVSKGRFKLVYFVENKLVIIARVWGCWQNPKKLSRSLK